MGLTCKVFPPKPLIGSPLTLYESKIAVATPSSNTRYLKYEIYYTAMLVFKIYKGFEHVL